MGAHTSYFKHYPASLVEFGKELFELKEFELLKKTEKSLFYFWSQNAEETNVTIHPNLKVTCSCQLFNAQQMCGHVVAVLLDIDKHKHYTKKQQTIKLNDVLDHISHDELKNFIRSYAQQNSKFGLLFKAHFARKINHIDPSVKYSKLLDSIIRPIRNNDQYYTASIINQFLQIGKELHAQMKDALSLEQYLEAFYIHKNVLQKCAYARSKAKVESDAIDQFYQELHRDIDLFFQIDIAPELRDKLNSFLSDILGYSYYKFPSFENNIAQKLVKFNPKTIPSKVSDLLKKRFQYSNDLHEMELILATEIFVAKDMDQVKNEILPRIQMEHLKNICKILIDAKQYDLLIQFLGTLEQNTKLKKYPVDDVYIYIARRTDNTELLVKGLFHKYVRTRNKHILLELLNFETGILEPWLPTLIKVIKARLHHIPYLVLIDLKKSNIEQAFDQIETSMYLDLLKEQMSFFRTKYSEQLDNLVHNWLKQCRLDKQFYYKYFMPLKSIFLFAIEPKNPLWVSLFEMTENFHQSNTLS